MISIPAPREGSDGGYEITSTEGTAFQSTLPVRGATVRARGAVWFFVISIHAPREGSDGVAAGLHPAATVISIHAPREGSDESKVQRGEPISDFNPRSP